MKAIFFAPLLLLFLTSEVSAQNVGIGTTTPDRSAVLDINGRLQGVLLPRMSSGERDAIQTPAEGLLIYQTDPDPGLYVFTQGFWTAVSTSSAMLANRSLSNLQAPTAINVDLLPYSSAAINLGSSSLSWKDFHFFGDVYYAGNRFIGIRGSNTFFGYTAGNPLITGTNNTATGTSALATNITGNWNTANGYHSLTNANNAFSNTAMGYQTLISNTSGSYNTGTGVLALANNNTGANNSAHGVGSLTQVATGNYNSAIGFSAGGNLAGGNQNTFLGALSDVSFGTNLSNSTAIGYGTELTASNSVRAGNTAVTSIGGFVGWTTFPSDGRFKRNVKENVPGLSFITKLRAVTYNVDVEAIDKALHPFAAKEKSLAAGKNYHPTAEDLQAKNDKAALTYTGFIAQDVEQAAKQVGFQFSGVDAPKNKNDLYGLRYAEFVVPLVKAVQELNDKTAHLESENASLKKVHTEDIKTNQSQQTQINRQQAEIDALKTIMTEMKKELELMKASQK